jgi:RHS repeat-associated protein
VVLHHAYDTLGRLIELASSDRTIAYQYVYDANDNVISVTDTLTHSTTHRSYDQQNRLLEETLGNGLTLAYTYDGIGRVSSVHFPDGSGASYRYEGSNLNSVSRIDANQNVLYSHHYNDYDLRGLEQQLTLIGKAGTANLSYDALGRLSSKVAPHWSEVIPENGYNAVGSLVEATSTDPYGSTTSHYCYDDLYQLTDESGHMPHTYAYDSICNRLAKDNQPYHVNGLNQVLDDSTATYSYDLNGNLLAKIAANQAVYYSYDALNRMTSAEGPGWKVCYTYDSFGRRLSQTYNSQETTHYLYQGECEVGSYKEGHLCELRILGKGKGAELGAAIAIELEGAVYAPIHDHRGNVCCLLDSSTGQPVQYYRYTAFGETTPYGHLSNPWQFASKRFDSLTGFHRFGKRDYDCSLGRWLTPDPAGFTDGPNLYAYVHNSPLILFDPWGLTGRKAIGRPKEHVGCRTSRVGEMSYCGGIVGILANWFPHERRKICSKICHDLFSYAASSITEAQRECNDIGNVIRSVTGLTQRELPENNHDDWVAKTHEKIDEVHYTDMAELYTPEAIEARSMEGPTLCMMPSPGIVLNQFHFNVLNLSKTAQNTIRILRGWAKSKGWKKLPNPQGAPEKWGVYNEGLFEWRLKIKPKPSFRPNLQDGSNLLHDRSSLPRFDARLKSENRMNVNPFTGEIGGKEIGTHIPLDFEW